MTIKSGSKAKAEEVRPQLYINLKNLITQDKERKINPPVYDDYFIDGFPDTLLVSGSTNWENYGKQYWTNTDGAELISKTFTLQSTKSYVTPFVDYIICETIDEFNDSSVDTNIWTEISTTDDASITEDSDSISIEARHNSDSLDNGSSEAHLRANNSILDSTHKYFAMKFSYSESGSAGGSTHYDNHQFIIRLSDGTNTANLLYYNINRRTGTTGNDNITFDGNFYDVDGGAGSKFFHPISSEAGLDSGLMEGTHLLEAIYNPDAEIVYVYLNGIFYQKVDVSSVGDLKLDIYAYLYFNGNSDAQTLTSKIDIDWVRREKSSPSSSLSTNISLNNGTNYQEVTREEENQITNTGTQFKIKNIANISDDEYIHLRGYGVFIR